MEKVVKSFNMFIDTDRGDSSVAKGDDYELELNGVNIDCDRNQFIRLSLNSFSMHKTWSNINQHNSRFTLVTNRSGVDKQIIDLSYSNYASINDLAENFSAAVAAQLENKSTAATTATVLANSLKPQTSSSAGTSTFQIEFIVEFKDSGGSPVAHGLGDVLIQFFDQYNNGVISDAYSILGGDRIRDNGDTSTDNTTNSIFVTSPAASQLKFSCPYHAQRFSESFVYLRINNITSNNLETQSLRDATNSGHHNNKIHHSNIFARFPQNNEFITYSPPHERDYYVDLQQKHLNNIRLTLTDSHNLPLPQSFNQSTRGNLNFSAVIRVDIIEKYSLENKNSGLISQNMPKRYNNLITDFDGHKI